MSKKSLPSEHILQKKTKLLTLLLDFTKPPRTRTAALKLFLDTDRTHSSPPTTWHPCPDPPHPYPDSPTTRDEQPDPHHGPTPIARTSHFLDVPHGPHRPHHPRRALPTTRRHRTHRRLRRSLLRHRILAPITPPHPNVLPRPPYLPGSQTPTETHASTRIPRRTLALHSTPRKTHEKVRMGSLLPRHRRNHRPTHHRHRSPFHRP